MFLTTGGLLVAAGVFAFAFAVLAGQLFVQKKRGTTEHTEGRQEGKKERRSELFLRPSFRVFRVFRGENASVFKTPCAPARRCRRAGAG
jgi:hypothetical protein